MFCLSKFHLKTSVKNKRDLKKKKKKKLPHLGLKTKNKKHAPLGNEKQKPFPARLEEKKNLS